MVRYPRLHGRRNALALLILLLPAASHAASGEENFRQAIRYALANNPNMAAAYANLMAAREQDTQALSALLPTVNLEAGQQHQRTEFNQKNLPGNTNDTGRLGATLNQAVFNWQAIESYRQVTPYIEAFAQDVEAMRQNLVLAVSQETIGLLQAKEVLRLAENNLKVTERHLEATQARHTVGELTMTDVSQARARMSLALANKINAENAVFAASSRYTELVGMPPAAELAMPPLVTALWSKPLSELQPMTEERPDMMAARLRERLANGKVDIQRAGHLPVVNLSSSVFKRTGMPNGNQNLDLTDYAVGLTLTVPVFNGGATSSRTDQARAERDAQVASVDRLRLQAIREYTQATLDIQSSVASVKAFEDGVKATKAALDGVEQEFMVGTRTALDLMDAQNEVFNAETNLAKSHYTLILAKYRLLQATGRLSLGELGIVDEAPLSTP